MKLIIKKWEFDKYVSAFDKQSNYSLKSFIDEIIKYGINDNNTKIKIINKKNHLIDVYGDEFEEDFFTNINEDKFNHLLDVFNKYNIINDIEKIEEIIIKEDLKLDNLNSNFIWNIIFNKRSNKTFYGKVDIINFNVNKDLENCKFKNDFQIRSCSLSILDIKKCNFSKNVILSFPNRGILNFSECHINLLNLDKKKISEVLSFKDCTWNITIKNSYIEKLNIIDSNFTKIDINNSHFNKRVKISFNSKDKKIIWNLWELIFCSNTISNLRVWHSKISKFEINNLKNPPNSEINLGNLIIDEFYISNIRNLWKFRIYNINYSKKNNTRKLININNSSLWDSEFQNVNLNSFSTIVIYDNLLTDLKYTWISWWYMINVDKNDNYWKLRNTYRTLKDVAEKNNDNITALKFYSWEMNAYKMYLIKKWFKNNKLDLTIIWFNEFSSNFWLNFIKPLFLIIIINIFFIFTIMLFSNDFIFTKPSFWNFNNFVWYISRWFNITNWLNWIFKMEIDNGLLDLLILIKNIFIWTFLYQLIQAFRKFTRKI